VKIAIMGAGAMGGVWAARLQAAGNEVVVVDVAPAVVEAINRDGLVVEDRKAGTTATAQVRATGRPAEVGAESGAVEVVLFFTKAHHTPAAAELARPLVDDRTTVVSLQNGWGNSDVLAGVYPPEQIAMGVTYHSATVLAPGRVAHTNTSVTFLGPYLDGAPLDRARAFGEAMTAAGIETTVTPAVKTEIWKKLILNSATLPVAGLTRLRTGEMGKPGPLLDDVADALVTEAVSVAIALGLDIELEERIAFVRKLLAGGGAGKASMLQDVEAQRKTEIEVVNGAIVREADRLGVPVPLNRAMVALVNGLERSWTQD
jgi:2-dehydropantoate 2-reductase